MLFWNMFLLAPLSSAEESCYPKTFSQGFKLLGQHVTINLPFVEALRMPWPVVTLRSSWSLERLSTFLPAKKLETKNPKSSRGKSVRKPCLLLTSRLSWRRAPGTSIAIQRPYIAWPLTSGKKMLWSMFSTKTRLMGLDARKSLESFFWLDGGHFPWSRFRNCLSFGLVVLKSILKSVFEEGGGLDMES